MEQSEPSHHAEHLAHAQDHYRWRAEHMRALALLKRAEAAILAHEARIIAHDGEIARHEEAIAHGAAHAPAPPEDEHARFAAAHAAHGERHEGLLAAIAALEAHLEG